MQVTAQFQGAAARVEQDRFETPLKKMPAALVTPVEPGGVTEVEPLHGAAQMGFAQAQQQMIVVVHQREGAHAHPEAVGHFRQRLEKMGAVPVIPKDGTPLVAAAGHVIPSAGVLDAQGPGHGAILKPKWVFVNC